MKISVIHSQCSDLMMFYPCSNTITLRYIDLLQAELTRQCLGRLAELQYANLVQRLSVPCQLVICKAYPAHTRFDKAVF